MPVRSPHIPKYRHYRPKDLAVVRIAGRDRYLGKYDSDESTELYRRLIAEYLSAPPPAASGPAGPGRSLSMTELVLAYWDRHVVGYYVKDGRPTSERDNIRQALRFARRLYDGLACADFGPMALKAVRQSMIEAGRSRRLINKDVNRIRAMVRWAVENELVPAGVHQALIAVAALREGRSEARETEPVRPVAVADVEATLPLLPPQVAAMVRLQLLTGARPGEITALRPCDVDCSGGTGWVYAPPAHKTAHHGRARLIVFGPRAREVLAPWLERLPDAYCFSPAEAEAWRHAARRSARRSPMTPSQAARRPSGSRGRAPGDRYDKDSYRRAIQRAARKAGVSAWHPHQLRHTRATQVRAKYGIDAARALLGHGSSEVTETYAERDLDSVRGVMAEIG